MKWIRLTVVLFELIFVVSKTVSTEKVGLKLDGDDFVSYKLSGYRWKIIRAKDKVKIKFDFKTIHPDGMLLYIGRKDVLADFLIVDLIHGKLRVFVNLGDNNLKRKGDLLVESSFADNKWHKIHLNLKGRHLRVKVRGKRSYVILKRRHSRLDATGYTYIGGMPKVTHELLRGYKPSQNFKGCIRDVLVYVFDDVPSILEDRYGGVVATGYQEYGSPKRGCQEADIALLTFARPGAHLRFHSRGNIQVDVKMYFRTYVPKGTLVWKGAFWGRGPFMCVDLVGGNLVLKFRIVKHGQVIKLEKGKRWNDGNWHYLAVVVNESVAILKVDSQPKLAHFNPELKKAGATRTPLVIGRAGPDLRDFVGCIRDLRVDDKIVGLRPSRSNYLKVMSGCDLRSNCFPNPCHNHGECIQVNTGGVNCNCERTFHGGAFCEKPTYRKTCQEYKNLGLAQEAHCKVDPDGEGPVAPFVVRCNATAHQDDAVTIVSHSDAVASRKVSQANYIGQREYYHHYKYPATRKQIKGLVSQSKWCRQFVRFKCYASKLLPAGHPTVRWMGLGHDTVISDHWPGAPAGSNKCACGVNGTCADPSLPCNCDIGDKTWREDEGYVTEKANLPVTLVIFPKSTATQSEITVGPLECFGTLTNFSNIKETLSFYRKVTRFFRTSCCAVNTKTLQSFGSHTPRTKMTPALGTNLQVLTSPSPYLPSTDAILPLATKSASDTRTKRNPALAVNLQKTSTTAFTSSSLSLSSTNSIALSGTKPASDVRDSGVSEDPPSKNTQLVQFATKEVGALVDLTTPPPKVDLVTPVESFQTPTARPKETLVLATTLHESSTSGEKSTKLIVLTETTSDLRGNTNVVGLVVGNKTDMLGRANDVFTYPGTQQGNSQERVVVQIPWQLLLIFVILAVFAIMSIIALACFIKERRRGICGGRRLCRRKQSNTRRGNELNAGFPEFHLRSRSGEVHLSDYRQSIQAGVYNVRTGSAFSRYDKYDSKP
ncbi:contactin-associated protein-like 2 [Montipora capricornis]|uniref:contactin-associated protein-like 2 n=1 Tax=Montipora capricornis TaxID=246305 RepID=UPI0035F1E110